MAEIPSNLIIDHEAGTGRGVYATWDWSKAHTDHYEVWWEYSTSNKGLWFTGSESSEKHRIATYSYPENAKSVRVRVMPVAENKPNSDTPYWTSAYTKTRTYPVPKSTVKAVKKLDEKVTDLTIKLEAGTSRTLHAKWIWKQARTDFYTVSWQYKTSDGTWYYATTENVAVKESAYTAPENAVSVRANVLPISAIAYETDDASVFYWETTVSAWKKYDFPQEADIPISGAPSKLSIGIQNGTDDTIYATWSFSKHSQTDHYEVSWYYFTGDKDRKTGENVWYSGGTTNTQLKNATYSPQDNALKVRYSVLPVAKEVNGRLRFRGKRSAVKSITLRAQPVPAGDTVKKIKIQREAGNTTTLLASWTWPKHSETDHYEAEWRYTTGNKTADGSSIWFYPTGSQSSSQSATYSPPTNAVNVQVRIKPVAKAGKSWIKSWTPWSPKGGYAFGVSLDKNPTSNLKKTVTGVTIEQQNGSDNSVFATWEWDQENTSGYTVIWQYATGNGVWFDGAKNENVTAKNNLYSVPSNASKIRVRIKPISKTHKVQGIDTAYWTASLSEPVVMVIGDPDDWANTPASVQTPAIDIDGTKLTARATTYDENTIYIEFQIVQDDTTVITSLIAAVKTSLASVSYDVALGHEYKVRARGLKRRDGVSVETFRSNINQANAYIGDWSEYSENVETVPDTPEKIISHTVIHTDEILLTWAKSSNVTGYIIEYTTNEDYFDKSGQVTKVNVDGGETSYHINISETGKVYYVRVCAVNDAGESGWTPIYSFVLGTIPAPPTTWSDTTIGVVGDDLYLYWLHNSEDESSQSAAEVELTINEDEPIICEPSHMSTDGTPSFYIFRSVKVSTETIQDDSDDDILDSDGGTLLHQELQTYPEGVVVRWRVRTKGIVEEWSGWSTTRTIIIYAQPVIELYVGNNVERNDRMYELTKYPLLIHGEVRPNSQSAISYNVSIIANESYATTDYSGRLMNVRDQEVIFSKYIPATGNTLDLALTAGDVNLDSGITYTVKVVAAMDSSLTAEAVWTFTARWNVDLLVPDAEITVDKDRLCTYIRPFCNDEYGELIPEVLVSVYRLEYDGRLTELAANLDNGDVTIVDPHPSLNYARYRVVAMDEATGEIGFRDIPGQYIGETGIVIQWGEEWQPFSTNSGEYEDEFADVIKSGSMVKLPYNVEVSDSNSIDVALNEYIGRAHPVSYYGTQLGVKHDLNAVITRDDIETLYALRRLAVYMGDVYVREPSGVGYWANVQVSFSRRYSDMTIPVTLNVVRVEGGV